MFSFFAILFCLATFLSGIAFAEPGHYYSRNWLDREDSLTLEEIPDSLKATLSQKLQSDTGFVFWGYIDNVQGLAYAGEEFWTSDSITPEENIAFTEWINSIGEESSSRLDSVSEDLKDEFTRHQLSASYSLIKINYLVDKIYDSKSQSWKNAKETERTYTRMFFIRKDAYIKTNPPRLIQEISQIDPGRNFNRIFFQDGYSRIIDEIDAESFKTIATKPNMYIPNRYERELHKDMSSVYKKTIKNAIAAGDKDAVKYNFTMQDSFLVKANGKYFSKVPVPLTCHTRRLLSIYLGTFED